MNQHDPDDTRPVTGSLPDYLPVELVLVSRTSLEPLWDRLVRDYHYLGFEQMIGPRLKYLARYQGRPIAALGFQSAFYKIAVREAYLGWTDQQKNRCLKHVVNLTRCVIMPWVRIRHLASHLLSRTLKRLVRDWPEHCGTEPYLVETLVDPRRFRGTTYRAANWRFLGETGGYARVGRSYVYHGHRKEVYVYPLNEAKLRRTIRSRPSYRTLSSPGKRVSNLMLHIPDWSSDLLREAGITPERVGELGEVLNQELADYRACYSRAKSASMGKPWSRDS